MNSRPSHSLSHHAVSICRCDRWQVHQRLQELNVPSLCLSDGTLHVQVDTPLAAIQVWSVLFRITASRQQLLPWLERCWQSSLSS